MENFIFRPVDASESELIFSFLTIAARMDGTDEPIQKALSDKGLRKYWADWGRTGDMGVVALQASTQLPVSCAWLRLFSAEDPAYGFIAEDVPELGTGTITAFRNHGIGSKILLQLIENCKRHYPGISLSVREYNPAIRLYERCGFVKVAGSEEINRVGTKSFKMYLDFKVV